MPTVNSGKQRNLQINSLICRLSVQCMISKSNVFENTVIAAIMRLSLFSSKQCIIKQLLDSVFVISGIIKVSVLVLSASAFGFG